LLYIDRTVCTGYAACIDACPTGAIDLDEDAGVSTIDPALCDECMACVEVCPNGAIRQADSSALVPAGDGEIVEAQVIRGEVVPSPVSSPMVTIREPGRLTVLASAALTFVGSHLLPRAADALIDAMERRLTRGTKSVPPTGSPRAGGRSLPGKGGRGRGSRDGRGRRRRQRRRIQ